MLVHRQQPAWWFMEVPRTGTSTLDRVFRKVFPQTQAMYAKHWPLLPPEEFRQKEPSPRSVISARNPFSRAVSCWQYFTMPGSITFLDWTRERLQQGWMDRQVEARPQSFWYQLWDWDVVLRQEHLSEDFWQLIRSLRRHDPPSKPIELPRFNDINGPWVNRLRARTKRDRHWQEYYCPEAEQNVQELYAEDFCRLGHLYPQKLTEIA